MLSKIRLNLQLLRRPILINAYVFGSGYDIIHENWGDDINWYFLREIIKRPVSLFDRVSIAMRFNLKNYLVIGSTIDMLCKKNTEVWGAGLINGNTLLVTKPKRVYAVRGPLTRKALLKQGIKCPPIYGDPGLLVSSYYKPDVKKKYKYGFIPHRSNIDELKNMTIEGKKITEFEDILIIDLSSYKTWTDIPDLICSCENIISSSLHGLILAESYKIPNLWIKFGKPLIGDSFKFHDFFLSIGKDRDKAFEFFDKKISIQLIDQELKKWVPGSINLQPLIKSAPFEFKFKFE